MRLAPDNLPPKQRMFGAMTALGCRPSDWLSVRVADTNYRKRPTFGWHRMRSVEASFLLFIFTILTLVCISLLVGAARHQGNPSPTNWTAGLLSVAAITGTITALIQAVAIFGIQFHCQRLGPVSFLAAFYFDREGFAPQFAIAMGIVAANVVIAIVGAITGLLHAQVVLAALDIALVPTAIGMMVRLLVRAISSISIDLFDEGLIPAISDAYSRYLDEEARELCLKNAFADFLKRVGITQNPFFVDDGSKPDGVTHLPIPMKGRVIDINLACLQQIVDIAGPHAGKDNITLIAGVGDVVDSGTSVRFKHPERALPVEVVNRVTELLPRLYRVDARTSPALGRLLRHTAQAMPHVARQDGADELERLLNLMIEVLRLRLAHRELSVLDPTGEHATVLCTPEQDRWFPDRHWTDTVSAVCDVGDIARADVLLTALHQAVCEAARRGRKTAMIVFHRHILDLYDGIAADPKLGPMFDERFDSSLHVSLAVSQSYVSVGTTRANVHAKVTRLRQIEPVWVAWAFGLIHRAMCVDRATAAVKFLSRLLRRFREYENVGDVGDAKQPLTELRDWSCLGLIYVAGWCIRLIEKGIHQECAATVLKNLLAKSPSPARLLRAWDATRTQQQALI